VESEQNYRAEELAKLTYAAAVENIKTLSLIHVLEQDEELSQLDDAHRIMTVALAKSMLNKMVDLSGWAVGLSADGLEPFHGALSIDMGDDLKTMVRVHVAFAPEFEPEDRVSFVTELGKLINENV